MPRNEIEIIPPGQLASVQRPAHAPTPLARAPIALSRGMFARYRHKRQVADERRVLALYEERAKSEQTYWDAQTKAFESSLKAREVAFRHATQGELLQLRHTNEVREAQHQVVLAELARRTKLVKAETALAEAEFARDAFRERGLALARQRLDNDHLDLRLAAEERRAVLRQYMDQVRRPSGTQDSLDQNNVIDDTLYEARAQMNAHGLDTSRIDAIIEQWRHRWGR